MLKINDRLTVVGIGKEVKSYDITKTGPREKTWTYGSAGGETLTPLMTFGISEEIWGAAIMKLQVAGCLEYTATGITIPVGLDIRLSLLGIDEEPTPERLRETQFMSVPSDGETGTWKAVFSGKNGMLYCWTRIDRGSLDLMDCRVGVSVRLNPPGQAVPYICTDITAPVSKLIDVVHTENGTEETRQEQSYRAKVTVAGTCPEGATAVNISRYRYGICPHCHGSKLERVPCPVCGGTGKLTDNSTCKTCDGKGWLEEGDCSECGGTGLSDREPTSLELIPEALATAVPANGHFEVSFWTDLFMHAATYSGRTVLEAYAPPITWEFYSFQIFYTLGYSDRATAIVLSGPDALPTECLYYYDEYRVWCDVEDGEITAEITAVEHTTEVTTCLAGHTLITMADGTRRRLDSLRPGELVLGGDGQPAKITRLKRGRWSDSHTLYTFADGTVIDETKKHRFFNVEQGFWQYLKNWRIGEHAVREDGERVALVSRERINERVECFGLWTESHDYWAGGLLSGETAANQRLLAETTPVKAAEMLMSMTDEARSRLFRMEGFA